MKLLRNRNKAWAKEPDDAHGVSDNIRLVVALADIFDNDVGKLNDSDFRSISPEDIMRASYTLRHNRSYGAISAQLHRVKQLMSGQLCHREAELSGYRLGGGTLVLSTKCIMGYQLNDALRSLRYTLADFGFKPKDTYAILPKGEKIFPDNKGDETDLVSDIVFNDTVRYGKQRIKMAFRDYC